MFASIFCLWPSHQVLFRTYGFKTMTMNSVPFKIFNWYDQNIINQYDLNTKAGHMIYRNRVVSSTKFLLSWYMISKEITEASPGPWKRTIFTHITNIWFTEASRAPSVWCPLVPRNLPRVVSPITSPTLLSW